jgi:hypothetical protein
MVMYFFYVSYFGRTDGQDVNYLESRLHVVVRVVGKWINNL